MKHLGRKSFHVLGGLGLTSVYFALGRPTAFYAYAALLALVLPLEIARLAIPRLNAWAMARFSAFLRPGEARKLTGTPAYILGVALAFLVFPEAIATAAILFLVVGDVSATAVGERWGRTKVGGKSLEGTAAFVVAALGVGLLSRGALHAPAAFVVAAGAAVAALTELFLPPWANDNLVIPLAAGAAMTLLSGAA
jgi:dolichol kinase